MVKSKPVYLTRAGIERIFYLEKHIREAFPHGEVSLSNVKLTQHTKRRNKVWITTTEVALEFAPREANSFFHAYINPALLSDEVLADPQHFAKVVVDEFRKELHRGRL